MDITLFLKNVGGFFKHCWTACRCVLKNARVEKMPLNIRIQWKAGTACVSECMRKTPACRGLRVGLSKT